MHPYITALYEAAETHAAHTAVVDRGGERRTDYRAMLNLSLRTAAWLYGKNLPEGSFVPVRFPSCMEFAAIEIGVWMAGYAAVPMGTSFPEERVRYICMNCGAPLLIDESTLSEIRATEPASPEQLPQVTDDDIALLLYTSGSTGAPKGILHTFGGLEANATLGNAYPPETVFAMAAPFYFVASLAMFKVLRAGAQLHLLDGEIGRDVRKLEDYFERHSVTMSFISPSVLANFHNRAPSLKLVFTGSERLTGQCSRDGYKLYNNYGMSETLGTLCSYLVEQPFETTPVGIPNEKIEWALLDEAGNPVPDGEEGEMCVKGRFTPGYYKDPEATAKLWRGGWLHTGDLLKKLPDGNLVYINRKDWMVKINGQRVEPGEIENALRGVRGVDMAVVKAVRTPGGQTALCAWYTGEEQREDTLRRQLGKRLAAYMVPSFYMHLDSFPLNANGKIDRRNLPEPDLGNRQAEYAPPENETEALLCRAFEQALGVERIGIDDDFFALGGDSIRVMKLATLCRELDLSTKLVYAERTPRAIAAKCVASGAARRREKKARYPLSNAQTGIYIESMRRDGEAVYNNPILLRLGRGVDMERLRAAAEAVVAAHPFVKMRLEADEDGTAWQVRHDGEPYRQTLERMTEAAFRELVPTLMQPFRLLRDWLFRIRLFETEAGKYIFFDLHHIIFDGSSMLILFDDLEKAYRGETLETETYSGFELAEDEALLRARDYDAAKSWYLETFGGVEADSLPLPDRRGDAPAFAALELDLPAEAAELERFCASCGVTENIAATAAFGVLAALYSGADEALFATIYNGRDSLRTARTVAMLVRTLPVYSRIDAACGVREYLKRAQEQMLGCMNRDVYPFAELAAETGMSSDLLFVYQGDYLDVGGFAGEEIERIPLMENATGEQLALQLYKRGGVYHIRAEYRSDRYSEALVRILLESYGNILRRLYRVETLGELTLTTASHLEAIRRWNHTEQPYDASQTVVSLFAAACAKYPENTAVIYEDETLCYAELDRRSDALAAQLQARGLGRGDVVSILIPRGVYQAVASLGALKAGCAYQPLDGTYPPERLNFMVGDAAAKLLITTEELGALVTDYSGARLTLAELDALPDGKPRYVSEPEDLFILLYTSGSTGVPKGVRLTHGNLVCFIDWYRRFYSLTPADRVGQYASYGFDACMMDMYPALCSGAAVCIVPEEMRLDLRGMDAYFLKNRVTLAFLTTQVGRQFAVETENPYLRAVSVGGEKLASMEPPKGFAFYNVYGPTECTILSTLWRVTKREDNIPIGTPLDNLKCYVVDPFGHQVPAGALGELWIAGPHVGAGYLNRPDKTAEAFVDNPFDGGTYARAYRTGDIVRWRTDGCIEFIGRRDGQVKIHGFRIELSEVEAVIREFPGIRDVAMAAIDLGADGKSIAAYVVSDRPVDVDALGDFIRARKPPYMVPAATVQLDAIPLNQNGKVNRRALPKPELPAQEAEEEVAHEDNLLEQALREVVGEAVNHAHPPLNTQLSWLGLTSIGTIRLSTRLFKRFGVEIPVKELPEATITGLENRILGVWMNGGASALPAAQEEAAEEREYPLSAAQMGIYVDCMRSPDSTAYNIPSVLTFAPDTDPAALADAVRKVLRAHPSLHVHFELREDRAVSVRNETEAIDIPVQEVSAEECAALRTGFVRPFRLGKGPLYRFAVVRTETAVLLFSDFHHLVFDGFSFDLFLRELGRVLSGGTPEGENAAYASFVREQKSALESGAAENERYLAALLADFESASELTGDLGRRGAEGKKAWAVYPLRAKALDTACARCGVTEAGFLLAALDYTLARLTASERVYLSTISSGRGDVRFAGTFGMFVNTLPLAAALSEGSVDDFIRTVSKGLEQAIAHENIPFAEIAGKWGFTPRVMYEYQRGIVEGGAIRGLVRAEGLEPDQAKFPITVRIEDRSGAPVIAAEYDDALYSAAFMAEFVRSYGIVVEKFAAAGRERVRSVSLLDEKRRAEVEGFRETPDSTVIPAGMLYQHGMERWAAQTPEHTALIACDGRYTYRAFDEAANRVANALLSHGAKQGDRVAVLLPRTSRVLIAMFGVLKAGCAYIPCDPNYPTERVRHILDDSEAAFVITTQDRRAKFSGGRALDVEELLNEGGPEKPAISTTPEDLAYLIYTSGSTGKPKGVMLTHRGAVNYMTDAPANILVHAMVREGHVMTGVTTLSFDMSVKEFGNTLFNGLTIALADEDECNDALRLAKLMEGTDTDMFQATPSRLLTLMEAEAFRNALRRCRIIVCAGEKYPDALLHTLQTLCPDARIFNTYGPTEITVSCNIRELTGDTRVTVGRPLLNVKEFIVDSDGNALPAGVVGELYIGGPGVAKGYKGLPEMTGERFVTYRGIRVYRSGDYARWMPDGSVEILGRTDNQIKLRGLRIEIGEVESVLAAQPGIHRVAVKIDRINGIEHLCAWFTAERPVDVGELRRELGKVLTNYMVPTAYMQLDEMPLTPNGKLDLKNLSEAQLYRGDNSVKAANDIERAFCAIFSELLHVEEVGAEENFFDLGGTSLLVTNVVIAAQKRGLAISFGDVFAHPTPRGLAQLLGATEAGAEPAQPSDPEITDYDYDVLRDVLAANNLDSFRSGEKQELGDVLLTGAGGYLGIHILHELLEKEMGKIYCLLRGRRGKSAKQRLVQLLFYYFNRTYEEELGKRLIILEGDVTDPKSLESLAPGSVQTVINCAALVKHFSQGTEIEDVNVGGARNLIDFCLSRDAVLIQTSTMSTVSAARQSDLPDGFVVREQDLYFHQVLENKYIHSKFLAERAVVEAVAKRGLRAKIMRLGNLAARHSDGEFQINFRTNSAMGRLRAFAMLGCCAYDQLDVPMEFSPIDAVAEAIVALSKTPEACILFHPFNHQQLLTGIVFREMSALGLNIRPVEREEFAKAFAQAQSDPVKAQALTSIMAYQNTPGQEQTVFLPRHNEYTMQVLYRLGYRWPVTTWDYVRRFIEGMKGLGFFDADGEF